MELLFKFIIGLPLTEKIMPQYLKDLGYATHLVGKWHLGHSTKAQTPNYRGFDSFYGYYLFSHDYYDHTADNEVHPINKNCLPLIFSKNKHLKIILFSKIRFGMATICEEIWKLIILPLEITLYNFVC